MKVFSIPQIQQADRYTIENEPIESIDLMERASIKLFEFISSHYSTNEYFIIFAGSGNNGGDAFALARLLYKSGYHNILVYSLEIGQRSKDCQINYERLIKVDQNLITNIKPGDDFPEIIEKTIVIDGIFGSGLTRSITGYWGDLVQHINNYCTEIISIDLPSGLFGDNNLQNEGSIINANITLSFQFPKLTFFFVENEKYLGDWNILDIQLHPEYIEQTETQTTYLQKEIIAEKLKSRNKFSHKGNFGHALLVAGGYGKTGAAILSSKACLQSGVGLLTADVPESDFQAMYAAISEAMLIPNEMGDSFFKDKLKVFNAVGIGPGIGVGEFQKEKLYKILSEFNKPLVIDADAINIISDNKEMLDLLTENTILTPHPGEFDRLTKKHSAGYERFITQREFSIKYRIIIVLKGAYTSIALPNGDVFFNSTGNPGMATAGSGDVLTGIILSLLAQGYSPKHAAIIGVYLHGLAGDIAAAEIGHEALIASDIINNLGYAFKRIKK